MEKLDVINLIGKIKNIQSLIYEYSAKKNLETNKGEININDDNIEEFYNYAKENGFTDNDLRQILYSLCGQVVKCDNVDKIEETDPLHAYLNIVFFIIQMENAIHAAEHKGADDEN